jgi:ubiquinone/menaquinone biosynthesis C-methylase UbiE
VTALATEVRERAVGMIEFDEERARQVDRTYATPDVVAQREKLLGLLALRPGERVLDIGSGPGYLAASMADAVGPSGAVVGVDASGAMNTVARTRCADRPWVTIDEGDAGALPFTHSSVDVAVSTQVYEYVPDVPAALAELHRVLRPGGRAVVLDTDWDSVVWNATDRARHQRIMTAWDEHLADPYLPRTLSRLLREAGFTVTASHVIPIFNPEYDADTFGASVIPLIATFVPGRRGISDEDAAAWAADISTHADYFFSVNRYCFVASSD